MAEQAAELLAGTGWLPAYSARYLFLKKKETRRALLRNIPTALLVNLTPVRDPRHIDPFRRIADCIHDAIISDADSPTVPVAMQLFAARRPWIIGKIAYLRQDAFDYIRGQVTKFPLRRRSEDNFIDCHLILPSARSSASTSSRLKRGSPALASEIIPSSISS